MTDETKSALTTRIEMVEKELADLKKKRETPTTPSRVTLRGIWKDIEISDEDIDEAKRSLFREIDDI